MSIVVDWEEEIAAELDIDVEVVESWAGDLYILAKNCLDGLSNDERSLALKYLTAFMLSGKQGSVTSDRFGDASLSFATVDTADMRANPYGRMALNLAPCLSGMFYNKKRYGAVRLIR